MTEDELKTTNIKDRISAFTWARKVVSKHQHLDTLQENIDIMTHQVKFFIEIFTPVFKKGLSFFWEEKGCMFSQKQYHDRPVNCRLNHRKFEDMQQYLSGNIIIDKS